MWATPLWTTFFSRFLPFFTPIAAPPSPARSTPCIHRARGAPPAKTGPFPVSPDLERLPCLALALGPFSRPCVGFGSLPSHGQPPAVPESAITPDVDEPFDVHRHLLAEVSLHLVLPLNDLPQLHDLILAEILHARRRRDSRLGQDLGGQPPPDAIDVGQPDMDLFLPREVNSGDACHISSLLCRCALPLPLFVPGIRAEHSNNPATPDYSTFRADRFDRRFHFHGRSALTRDGCRYLNRYVIRPRVRS